MNTNMMIDIDPLSSYEAQYEYPVPNPHYYPHPSHPNITFPYKNQPPPQNYSQNYQPTLPETRESTVINYASTETQDYSMEDANTVTAKEEEEDIKPDISIPIEPKKTIPGKKKKGKTSNYWNKKITDKEFAFYGCSICNIAYKDIQELDQHVIIHANRITSYDLRIQNMKKRKRIKKEKKKKKKEAKVKVEVDIDIKPEDGYIGTEKATEFAGEDNKSDVEKACTKLATENNENSPVNNKTVHNSSNVNVYKCFGCNKLFALSYYLRIHVRSHTDEKPYTCSVCGQSFITASKLNRHNKRIHLAVRHQCRICFKFFSRFELLVKHFDSKHADDKLEGEPYDYNAILPYLKELEEQFKLEKEQEPKAEDPWDVPVANTSGSRHTDNEVVTKQEELVTKEEEKFCEEVTFVTKEEDKVLLPPNIEFFDENKAETDESKDALKPIETTDITVEQIKVDIDIKQEPQDEDQGTEDQRVEDQGIDDQGVDDQGAGSQAADDDDDDSDSDVKQKKDAGTDEEYFPTDTWAKSPSPLPQPPSPRAPRRGLTSSCHICKKKLSSKSYLRVHMRTHTGEKPFSCYICGRAFITASKMHRHVLRHDESWEGKDEKKVKVEDEVEVKIEPKTEEKDAGKSKAKKKSIVDKKNASLANKSSSKPKKTFFEKKPKTHKKWPHVCEFCHQRFLHLETLQVHKKSHEGTDLAKCHYCLEPQVDMETLKEHEGIHTGPKPYMCTICGHSYKKKAVMMHHRKTRCKPGVNDKTFICDICSKRYNSQTKLQRHIISHSVSKFTLRYECPVCAHMFHTRYHVQMHLKSHMKEGLILEENRNAVLAMVLQNARKIPKNNDVTAPSLPDSVTTDERSRICNICGQIFHHFYYLEEHLKTHGSTIAIQDLDKEEEKKYTCQVCSKSFKLHYYLKLHSYTHTKEKPFICQQCGKGFITKGKLKRHLETHQGLKKYQCHICYKFFTRPSYLRIHVRTIHGTQDYVFRDYGFGMPVGVPNDD